MVCDDRSMVAPEEELRNLRERVHQFATKRRKALRQRHAAERERVGLVTSDKTEHKHEFQQWLAKHGGGARVVRDA